MKNGLFITNVDLYKEDALSNGIVKKVMYQISALNIEGQLSCKPLILPVPVLNPVFKLISYLLFDIYRTISIEPNLYDFIYIRRISPVNYGFIRLIKKIKEKNSNCKIIYEVPTFPYDKEHKTIKEKTNLFVDKIFRVRLRKYIDRMITVSDDNVIFGVSTIKIMNGICCSDIQVRTSRTVSQDINLIVVAQFAPWHGYDRLIEGINQYYKQETLQKIYIHFIGDGPELNAYKKLTQQYCLSNYITFYGALSGEKLTDIFNLADIAVCSLGAHRIGIFMGSFLKSREYLARGLPIISSTKIDILPDNFKYCLYVPEDESPINIQIIIKFYNNLIINKNISDISHEIRQFAENNCDISITMKPVIDYITTVNILIISAYFPPENSIAALRPYSWAKWWTRAEYEVTILTTEKPKRKNDLLLDCSQFKVISLPVPFLSKALLSYRNTVVNNKESNLLLSFIKKCYSSFSQKTGCFYTCRFPDFHDLWAKNAIKKIHAFSFDYIISTGGPYSVHLVGLALKKKNSKIKWIVDWRDLWTCNHIYYGLKIFRPYEKYLEKKIHNNADLITTVSEPLADILRNMTKTKVKTIYNGYDPDDYNKIKEKERKQNDAFIIVYTGTIYRGFRDISPLFEAVSNLKNKNLIVKNSLQIIFAGANADVSDIAEYYHVSEFYFYRGLLPREDALQLQYDADAVLFLEYNNPSVTGILTGKLFEYLYIAREIIAVGIDEITAAGKLINDTKIGFCFGSNVQEIEEYLLKRINNNEKNILIRNDKLIQEFERKNQAIKLIDIINIL